MLIFNSENLVAMDLTPNRSFTACYRMIPVKIYILVVLICNHRPK